MGKNTGMRIIQLRNPELLEAGGKILVRGQQGIVLPKNAFVMFNEDTHIRQSNPIPHILIHTTEFKWCPGCVRTSQI